MRKIKFLLLTAMIPVIVVLFTYTKVAAQTLGDGICDDTEFANNQCARLGNYVLEILPSGGQFPVTGTCQLSSSVVCSLWSYRFKGPPGDNQINFLIPASIQVISGCQQLFVNGAGDPTTGFGKGIITHNTCRVAANPDPTPGFKQILIATTLALGKPIAVHLKAGSKKLFDDILGPFNGEIPRLAVTTEQVTTISGATLTIETNQIGDLVSATASTGPATIVGVGKAILCSPKVPTAIFPDNFPTFYDCQPIVHNDGKNIQAGNNSTCYYRLLDGSLIKFSC